MRAGAVLVLMMLAGCGASVETEAAEPRSLATSPAATPANDTVSCADLLRTGWDPTPTGDLDVGYDPEQDVAEVYLSEGESVRVRSVGDPECLDVPDIGRMIHLLPAQHEENLRQECEAAVRDYLAGTELRKGDIVITPDGLRDYVLAACPEYLAAQVR